MKILILSKKFPYPLHEGEPIAITYLSRALSRLGCEVSILVMNTTKHYFDPEKLPASYDHFKKIYSVKVDNRITVSGAVKSLVLGRSYILSRFDNQSYRKKLTEVLQSEHYDIVQLETVYMAHYIPVIREYSKARISMRAHNVEHEIWERVAATSSNPLKKWYLRYQNTYLKAFEQSQLAQYDLLLAITQRDLDVFRMLGYKHRSVVVPVGINLGEYQPDGACFENKRTIGFIGALDWMPNQFGISWFMEEVWPSVRQWFPEMELHIAGKNTPAWMKQKNRGGIFVHGEVPDAKSFINQHPVLIAPLFSGSGIKIKVLEGMAMGRVVVTTPVGREGIPAIDGEHLLVANDPLSFADAIRRCFRDTAFMRETGSKARQFIGNHFDNMEIGSKVVEAYKQLKQEI